MNILWPVAGRMALSAHAVDSKNVLFLEKYNRWHCREKHAAPQFTLKTGTIFEDSPIGLDKWLTAMWMVVNCKNGVSSWEISRTLEDHPEVGLVHGSPNPDGIAERVDLQNGRTGQRD